MEWKDYLMLFLILIAAFCLYKLIKVMRKSEKKEAVNKAEQQELLQFINDSDFPTIAIDMFAENKKKSCTRFLMPGIPYGEKSYLSVFLEDSHYEFIGHDRNWKILGR